MTQGVFVAFVICFHCLFRSADEFPHEGWPAVALLDDFVILRDPCERRYCGALGHGKFSLLWFEDYGKRRCREEAKGSKIK